MNAQVAPTSDTRQLLVRRAFRLSLLSIFLSGILGGIAVVVGLATDSLALLGFGFDAAIDGAASIALAWRFATETRYPHRTDSVERAAELIVGCVLLILAAYLGFNAVTALINDAHPEVTPVGIAISLVSVVILPPLAIAKRRTANGLGSGALRADSVLTMIAAVLALISLVGLALTQLFGLYSADAIGALIVTAVLLREGWFSIRAAPIEDTAPSPEESAEPGLD